MEPQFPKAGVQAGAVLRILLVDDNPLERGRLAALLLKEFPDSLIDEIADGKRFAYLLEVGDFDLVITELKLQWSDGLSVLRAVKERYPHRPVLMCTASGSDEVVVEAMKAGLDDYLVKSPAQLARLPQAVWSALENAQLRQAQQAALDRFRSLFEHVPVGLYRSTPEGQLFDVNPAFRQILGYSEESLAEINTADLYVNAEEHRQFKVLLEEKGVVLGFEAKLRRGNGVMIWVQDKARACKDSEGRTLYYEGSLVDITERKEAQEAMAKERDLLRTVIDHLPDYIYVKDIEGRFVVNNLAHVRALGARVPEEVVGKTDFDFFPQEVATQYRTDEKAIMESGKAMLNREQLRVDRAGKRSWVSATKVPWRNQQEGILGTVGISRDITDRRLLEEQVALASAYDPSTGLPNRGFLLEVLRLLFVKRRRHAPSALLCLDLDYPGLVEKGMSDDAAKDLFVEATQRIQRSLRAEDMVARLSWDRFAILLYELAEMGDATRVAQRIHEQLSSPFEKGGQSITITVNIGMTLAREEPLAPEEFLHEAETAMYRAKATGKPYEVLTTDS